MRACAGDKGERGCTGHKPKEEKRLPFPPAIGFKEAPLPLELLNEPFAFGDNGHRMIKPARAQKTRFLFEIGDNGQAKCTVGEIVVSPLRMNNYVVPMKSKTSIDVLSIYHVYGLGVVYSFLKHLYTSRVNNSSEVGWVLTYLQGSLILIAESTSTITPTSTDGRREYISYLISTLLYHLVALEAMQPKMIGELEESKVEFPPEVLALITGNPTLSKDIQLACYK